MTNYAEILVVDDMPDHITYSVTLLRAEGYRIFAASSGKAAMYFLDKHIPDLLLLDIQMEDINGLEICRMIKANDRTRDIPIIFLTSETSPEIIARGFELGGCDYVKKPFVKEEYLARIRTHLKVYNQQKQLTAMNNELTQFCSAVSHDLKAPFNIINMLIEMLRSELGEDTDDNIKTIMDMIVSKATQTKTMIERLFEFSKMCNVEANVRRIDITGLAKNIFNDLYALEPEGRKIEFTIGELPLIDADEVLAGIMLKNLLSNAIKYTSKREKAVIRLTGWQESGYCVIKLKDNGSGFDMTYSKKLFQVFQRLHSDEEFEGSGVGLALIKRIMDRHGGKIEAHGEVDKGAEFLLWFPVRG